MFIYLFIFSFYIYYSLVYLFLIIVLASLAAVVPLASPYVAALPAVLELFIVDGDWTTAVLFIVLHMAPSFYVDTAIYREIEG